MAESDVTFRFLPRLSLPVLQDGDCDKNTAAGLPPLTATESSAPLSVLDPSALPPPYSSVVSSFHQQLPPAYTFQAQPRQPSRNNASTNTEVNSVSEVHDSGFRHIAVITLSDTPMPTTRDLRVHRPVGLFAFNVFFNAVVV